MVRRLNNKNSTLTTINFNETVNFKGLLSDLNINIYRSNS